MTTATAAPPVRSERSTNDSNPAKLFLGLLGMFATGWLMGNTFLSLAYYPQWYFGSSLLMAVVGMIAGIGGAALLFYFMNVFVEALPRKMRAGLIPYAFILPAFALIGLMLLYPTVQTINYSFANNDSTRYVGLRNYKEVLGDNAFWIALTNNALWLIVVPTVTVALGVAVALFADRLSASGEKVAKSFIFLPMAISFVAASTIWGVLVYDANPNVGLLNAILGMHENWIRIDNFRLNSFLMMIILIWMQTGFAMVLLSGAIKGVPEETLEAARIDGANERQVFFQVIAPQIKGTVITVFITIVILVLKIFDIIYVLTNGQAKTNVIALMFFQELFTAGRAGRASAIVVILLILVLPVLIYQVRHYRKEQGR